MASLRRLQEALQLSFENECNQVDAHQGSKRPLLNTMLEAVSMRLPPHSTVAHMGRGVTPHCSWHLSMDSFRLKGCRACHGSGIHQFFFSNAQF